jgi:ankyrin repeat protein
MKAILRNIASVMWIAVSLAMIPSCRKTKETVKSDLEEAGYQLTTNDWFRASRGNDVAALKKFVSGKFPIDTRDATGDSALHAAAAGGAQASADYLLDRGLSVDLRGGFERTPLMAAVMEDQTAMVRWLLRQGADPKLKDKDGFRPLMLAVREGKPGSVGELAASSREDLDPALLLAALVGRADVIDALTNFGASVYTQMEDGRSPLMIAAENGHTESVKLLLEMGAGRFTTDPDGRTAADLAIAAGHPEIAEWINRDPIPADLALDSPTEIAKSMDAFVDAAAADVSGKSTAPGDSSITPRTEVRAQRPISRPISGEVLSSPVTSGASFAVPPLVMRHFREKEVPLRVKTVQGDTATVSLAGPVNREVKVRAGDTIPGSSLVVVRVRRRMEDSKVNLGRPGEISVMEVRDSSTGTTREWISGVPSKAHDPVALVEDSATGKRYLASPGQKFKGADGAEYLISDVRPNQIVIQEVATGAVQTIPLQGPRG